MEDSELLVELLHSHATATGHNLLTSCANYDLVLSIAVDKVPSLVPSVFPFLLVHCRIHLLTLLTPNRNYHYVQRS